jgi:CheY-like chemotaxis protein
MPGRRTILVVDDEPMVREIAAEHLAEHGYTVLSAADGYEALPLVSEHPIDVLFTDVVMPGLSGFELANRAKLIRPELGIVYATGYGYSAAGCDRPRHGHVLQKPYRAHELLVEIERACPKSEQYTRIDAR